jgi:hypothetical protein
MAFLRVAAVTRHLCRTTAGPRSEGYGPPRGTERAGMQVSAPGNKPVCPLGPHPKLTPAPCWPLEQPK